MNKLEQMRRKLKKNLESSHQKPQQSEQEKPIEISNVKPQQKVQSKFGNQNENAVEQIEPQNSRKDHLQQTFPQGQIGNPVQENQQMRSQEKGQQQQNGHNGQRQQQKAKNVENGQILQPQIHQGQKKGSQIEGGQQEKNQDIEPSPVEKNQQIKQKNDVNRVAEKEPLVEQEGGERQEQQQGKKSKIQMLREKIRLKKVSGQESNRSIPEETNANKTDTNPVTNQLDQHHQQDHEQEHGTKRVHLEEVKDAVLFEGMREDHIPVEELIQNQPQVQVQHLQQIIAQKVDTALHAHEAPIESPPPGDQNDKLVEQSVQEEPAGHTLFYQMIKLNEFLGNKQVLRQPEPKDHSQSLHKVRELASELQRLRRNIEAHQKLHSQ